jgi:hypothetical protein
VQAYHLLFDGFTVNTTDPVAQAAAERKRAMDQAVVDYVKGDVNRLRDKLGAAEQLKLDSHLNSLHEIEKGLAAPMMTMTGAKCMVPAMPNASQFPSLKQYNGGEPYFDAITNAHIDILAQALACDITRFATLFMNDLSYTNNPLQLPSDNHGSVAHTYSASSVGMNNQPGSGDPASWVNLAKFNGYAYSKVARLMKALDDLGALDSTIIYVTSDMGNPALHSTRNVPTVIAGGTNGKFKMGRRVKVAADCPASNVWCENQAGYTPTPNSQILVSIAQAFGVDTNTFGTQPDPKNTTGALSALTG